MKTPDTAQSPEAYHDAISERARELWRERGQPAGQDVEIWLEAERQLVERGRIPGAPPAKGRTKLRADSIPPNAIVDELPPRTSRRTGSPTAIDPTDLT